MKKIIYISALALGMTFSACDGYLDINRDPNSPAVDNVEVGMIMPAVEMNIAWSYGDYLRIVGGYYSQIYAHLNGTSNYLDYSRFQQTPTRSSGTYTQLYQRALSNTNTILEKSKSEDDWGTFLAATTLKAFTYQALVDCYGSVPYREAINKDITTPKYDDGLTIYQNLVQEIDNALAKVTDASTVCTNFLFPGQKAEAWIEFANAIKLRLLMRMSSTEDVQTALAALIQENRFPTSDVEFSGCWVDEASKRSPFYAEEFADGVQQNICANLAIVGTMQTDTYTDPRLEVFFKKNKAGKFVGSVSGTNYTGTSLSDWCRPVATPDMAVSLISVAEVEFFKAEYYARYGTPADAEAAYNRAIEASFSAAGVDGATEYIAKYPYDATNYKRSIGIAKWVALSGINPFEAWCEVRRLDYPAFGTKSANDFFIEGNEASFNTSSYEPGTLYTPLQVFAGVGSGKLIERFPYPEASSSRNPNTPQFLGYITPIFWGE